uniref:Thiamine pyrophosphate enzyme TPP-binding domain-containing protein n=1 Tax=Ananas comosus var. bracteatus TaxID=296719 RepID=A0A6V7P1I7_ANACO|nr:unnamed protein product [Ananas comosus var. bracteatus]
MLALQKGLLRPFFLPPSKSLLLFTMASPAASAAMLITRNKKTLAVPKPSSSSSFVPPPHVPIARRAQALLHRAGGGPGAQRGVGRVRVPGQRLRGDPPGPDSLPLPSPTTFSATSRARPSPPTSRGFSKRPSSRALRRRRLLLHVPPALRLRLPHWHPLANTLTGLGSYPTDGGLSLGMLRVHGHNSDLLLAFGVRFDDRATGRLESFAATAGLHRELNFSSRLKELDEQKQAFPLSYRTSGDEIAPQRAIQVLDELTGGEVIVSTGVGQHQMWAAQYYNCRRPRQWLSSAGLGAIGFGLPAARGRSGGGKPGSDRGRHRRGRELPHERSGAGDDSRGEPPGEAMILNNQHSGMVVYWEDMFSSFGFSSFSYQSRPKVGQTTLLQSSGSEEKFYTGWRPTICKGYSLVRNEAVGRGSKWSWWARLSSSETIVHGRWLLHYDYS